MAERYPIAVKVVSQKGTCAREHKVDDEWLLNQGTPAGMCMSAFNSMYPAVRLLTFGGVQPWDANPDVTTVCCSDPDNPVVFELRRLRK